MNRIGIISPNSKTISTFLKQEMGSIECTEFMNVGEFADRLDRSPLRVDTLIIQDGGLSQSTSKPKIMESAEILKRVIANSPLFEVDRIIYLNKKENTNHYEVMKWFEESKEIKNKTTLIIHSYEKYTLEMIKQFLLQFEVSYDNEVKYNLVIRKERNKGLESKYLDRFETDKTVIIEHSMANPNIPVIKRQLETLAGDDVVENTDSTEDKKLLEEVNINIETLPKTAEYKKKVIGVVGESKSGTSTTAMILASTLSMKGKTLVIDMNYNNLGLSYLVEKTLIPEEINIIRMSTDLLEDRNGLKVLKEKIYNNKQLHALVNSLPVKTKYDNEMYAYFISNIVNSIKSSYDYIVLDIPLAEINYYLGVLNHIDKLVLTSPPYINNIVGMLEALSNSVLKNTDIYYRLKDNKNTFKDIIMLRTLVFARVNKEIKPMSLNSVNKYSSSILNRIIPTTGVYVYSGTHYIDTVLLNQIMGDSKEERVVNNE